MRLLIPILSLFLVLSSFISHAQSARLRPGFDPLESEAVFRLNVAFFDTAKTHTFTDFLAGYAIHYRSSTVGLDNSSDIWIREDSVVVVMLRGTTSKMESILADFYCAMMPAQGVVMLGKGHLFEYRLADDSRAAVHAGFLIGFAYLADEVKPVLDDLYAKGYRDFLIGGHSQGGALCYYFSAWLMQLRKRGVYEAIRVKTYASASPKVGNMYFAYDYDNINRSEWSFGIVNAVDPVPEMPFTTQQIDMDMNEPNPILNLMKRFDELPFFKRIVLKRAFNRMRKRTKRSSDAYQKYLGKYVGGFIHQSLPGMALPPAVPTTYFVRPGVPITLSANEAYWVYCKDMPKYFHHGIDPYRFLLRQYYEGLPVFEPTAGK